MMNPRRWFLRRIDEHIDGRISLTLIRWREKGNLLNAEQKRRLPPIPTPEPTDHARERKER